ncbi:CbiX/SirB N-terminal domain-containing protein [Paenibacillus chitinolyticus]|uniref:sirohydrochlorin chelatase n=1 Tax=Paenibacillus chitinolyticus TaxID=79263 RepID=UPI002DB5C71A|nr:CbiX/SirB N-terminal domain-containing protein [Paenibacillus chitinolyticus]MEC0246560.1 CbiX/SirB N-terminal domain-containing protein [Paenibacillus chitinolyticus]
MRTYGILVISHGSRSREWVQLVDEAVAGMRVPDGVPVFGSFLELVDGRLIQDGITWLENRGVTDLIVIPLFVSKGSTHLDEIAYALGLKPAPLLPTDLEPFEIKASVHMTPPMDEDAELLAEMVYEKIRSLSEDPEREIVLLVGHGSVEQLFHLAWRGSLERISQALKKTGGFGTTDVAMLLPDQTKRKLEWWQERKPGHAVIIAPLFLSEGYFTREVIPSRLEGFDYRYNGQSILPSPKVSEWLERQVASFFNRDHYEQKR